MRELPILFNTDMVRAILDGTKTQTRRIVKPQPYYFYPTNILGEPQTVIPARYGAVMPDKSEQWIKSPYQVGDILYVRETWARLDCSCCEGDNNGKCPSNPDTNDGCYMYRATHYITGDARWRPSIHMPKEAARLWLEVTDVRVERLQEITEKDARAEGIVAPMEICSFRTPEQPCNTMEPFGYRYEFSKLWDSLYQKQGYGWEVNDWVWVYGLKRLEGYR